MDSGGPVHRRRRHALPVAGLHRSAAGGPESRWRHGQRVEHRAGRTWPGRTYNQVKRFFETGQYLQNYVAAEGRCGSTNFHVSLSNLQDGAVMPGLDGLQPHEPAGERGPGGGREDPGPGRGLLQPVDPGHVRRQPVRPDAHAGGRGPPGGGSHRSRPAGAAADPTNNESENPIYEMTTRRTLVTVAASWAAPTSGTPPPSGSTSTPTGATTGWTPTARPSGQGVPDHDAQPHRQQRARSASVARRHEAANASVTADRSVQLTDQIHTTTQLRYLYEDQETLSYNASSYDFAVAQVPTFDNMDQTNVSGGSQARRPSRPTATSSSRTSTCTTST